jgi:hypothetical protein
MRTTRKTLVDIYHPKFREGYQAGREQYFQENCVFTDKQLVELLQFVFEEQVQEEEKVREEGLYYSVGHLVGRMSGNAIPRHPHKGSTQELQDAFLTKVMQVHGAAGNALRETIGQFWAIQDQLAQTLDADSFEQMLNRGKEKEEVS